MPESSGQAGSWGRGLLGPFLEKDDKMVLGDAGVFIHTQVGERSCHWPSGHFRWRLSPLAGCNQHTRMTWGPGLLPAAPPSPAAPQYLAASAIWAPCPDPSSRAGLSQGWAQGAPLRPPQQLSPTQGARGQGLAAGVGAQWPWTCTLGWRAEAQGCEHCSWGCSHPGTPSASGAHLVASTSAADGGTVCSSSFGSR